MKTFAFNRHTDSDRRLIAVHMPDWSEWPRQVTRGVRRFAHENADWRVYFAAGEIGNDQVINHAERFDGIITASLSRSNTWRRIIDENKAKVVAVTSNVPPRLGSIPSVRVNDAKVAEQIGRHLMGGGFRRFAFIYGPKPGWRNFRAESMVAFAKSQGLPCTVIAPRRHANFNRELAALARLISRLPTPIGLVTWNLQTARIVIEACNLAKIQVPEQAATVAWDDDPMLAETLEPTISAAVLPAERIGYQAATLLERLIRGGAKPAAPSLIEPSGLIHIRQSSDVSALGNRDVYLAMQYIREHSIQPVRVDDIVEAIGLSRRTLERDFRKVTGMTLHDAMLNTRLERAKQFLMDTDWSTRRIATECGIGTEQTLRLAFNRREGMTPGAYRETFGQHG